MPSYSDRYIESNLYAGSTLQNEIVRRMRPPGSDKPYDHAYLVTWPALDLVPRGTVLGDQMLVWADHEQFWCVPSSHRLGRYKAQPSDPLDAWLLAAQSANVGGSILQMTAPHYGEDADLSKQTVSALIFTNESPVRDQHGRNCVDVSKSLRSWLQLCSQSGKALAF